MPEKIRAWMVFEVLSTDEKLTGTSLQNHIKQLEAEKGVNLTKKEFDEVRRIEKPHPSIELGYSQVCEVELELDNLSTLVNVVINYGPSMVDLLGPEKINIKLAEAQEAINLVSDIMQKFLEAGVGGIVLKTLDSKK